MPGNSGDDAVAPFAEYSELCDTPVFLEIANHESPDTTVYIVVQFDGAAAGAGTAAGTAAGQAGSSSDIDDSATIRPRPIRPFRPFRPFRPIRRVRRLRNDVRRESSERTVVPAPEGDGSAPVRSFMHLWYRPAAPPA